MWCITYVKWSIETFLSCMQSTILLRQICLLLYWNECTVVKCCLPSSTDMTSFLSATTVTKLQGKFPQQGRQTRLGKICDFRHISVYLRSGEDSCRSINISFSDLEWPWGHIPFWWIFIYFIYYTPTVWPRMMHHSGSNCRSVIHWHG